jgi:pilus assembly protein FimV
VFLNTKIIRRVTFLATSIVLSTAGHTVTLGDLRGSAVLGQPLDVSAWIGVGDGEAISEDCLSAQLTFGDFPQPSPKLHLQKSATSAAPTSLVRITSSVAVNEPVVTVVLRSTCGATTSRSYALLSDFPAADLPTVNALPAAKSAGGSASSPKTTSPVAIDLQRPLASSLPPTANTSTSAIAVRRKPAKVAAVTAPRKKPTPALHLLNQVVPHAAVGADADSGQLVLKLDSEIVIPTPAEMAAMAARRVSLPTLDPEGDVLKQSAQLESLQNDIKAFKDLTARNQANLASLETKLRQAEAERTPVVWLYLLGGLLVVALGALAWVLRQQRNAKAAWWHQADEYMAETMGPVASDTPSEPATMIYPLAKPDVQDALLVDLDFDLGDLSATSMSANAPLDMTSPTPFGGISDLNSEAISDIRQQAEFFVSLGQALRAIDLLRRQIQETTEPNPLVYLDLMTLYQSEGMKAEFRELRTHFNQFFHCIAPDFPAFHQEGRILLGYPELLDELVRVWANGEAVPFLDGCIFRNESSALHVDFDLAAFRDLLLLRTLVKTPTDTDHRIQATPLDVKDRRIRPVDVPERNVAPDAEGEASDQVTMPDAMLLTHTSWFTPPPVPTTEELDLEFPINMINATGTPGS